MLSLHVRPGLATPATNRWSSSPTPEEPRATRTRAPLWILHREPANQATFRAGGVSIGERASPLAVHLPLFKVTRDQTLELRAHVGAATASGLLFVSPAAVSAVARAREASDAIRSGTESFLADPGVVLATLDQRVAEVERASVAPSGTPDGTSPFRSSSGARRDAGRTSPLG